MGIKITEGMIDAGVEALKRASEDYAMRNAEPMPDWNSLTPDQVEVGRQSVKDVLKAGADYFLEHGNHG